MKRKIAATVIVAASVGAGVMFATAAPASAEPIASVCITITPTNVSVNLGGTVIATPTVELQRTCVVV